jgi:RNA polymerase sigma-70 factor (ECF subfamily)
MDEFPRPAGPTPATADSAQPTLAAGGTVVELDQDQGGQADAAGHLRAELKLQAALAAEGFAGEGLGALAVFGYEFIRPLVATGYIFTRCRQAGYRLLPLRIPLSEQEDLVQETVAEALRVFKDYGLERWQPEAGSLKNYFTGALLGQFANAWRRWLNDRVTTLGGRVVHRSLPLETLPPVLESPADPTDAWAQLIDIRRIKHRRTRAALVLTALGYSYEEIAELLGVTPRAVEGYLRRHRLRMAAARRQERKPP